MSKSFLEPFGANDNSMTEKLILEEFISGIKSEPNRTHKRTPLEMQMLETVKQKLREHYNWNETTNFDFLAAQKCSDMIVQVRKSFYKFISI